MSTFTLNSPSVPVTLPDGLSEETLLAFFPFNNWVRTLTRSLALQSRSSHPFNADPYELRRITVQAYDLFDAGRVGFLKMKADVSNKAGERLPGSIFLRGPSVAMLVILIPEDVEPGNESETDERHVILTVQARIPAGSLEFVELPAGMVDDDGTFAGTAAKEIKEELGLELQSSELICMSDLVVEEASIKGDEDLPNAMYPSVGGCDEFIPIYMHERRVPREQLKEWTGNLTGMRDHGEKITLKLVKMKDLWKEGKRDAKCLAALALWEGLKREGKL
ncbi:NUDIX domain-containing protein [Pseudomassariella vexata]|uniref:NUDIX domain-containing protein n=1 Tax=Pseudomassariella vexata TaxID=1141098 RepID=A0A1Y2E6U2_9PEZI|nr:NUDIX domain-containing protein [Pseudomassariella vexata]ORY67252.1 NUDIX domain-containing protein [Pseudomassariella vexata]